MGAPTLKRVARRIQEDGSAIRGDGIVTSLSELSVATGQSLADKLCLYERLLVTSKVIFGLVR